MYCPGTMGILESKLDTKAYSKHAKTIYKTTERQSAKEDH